MKSALISKVNNLFIFFLRFYNKHYKIFNKTALREEQILALFKNSFKMY